MQPQSAIRVFALDDRSMLRSMLEGSLNGLRDIEVVGRSTEPSDYPAELLRSHPDVILLGLGMRSANPLKAMLDLRAYYPAPTFVYAPHGVQPDERALSAAQLGALEILVAPPPNDHARLREFASELAQKIRIAARDARPVDLTKVRVAFRVATPQAPPARQPERLERTPDVIVALGASTGGVEAIRAFLQAAPLNFPPIAIVQHMPAGFTASFAARLNAICGLKVREAVEADRMEPGQVLIARGDTHLTLRRAGDHYIVRYTHQNKVSLHCPSVDVLFDSFASAAGARGVGVLLTGMGEDGARGLLAMRKAGALTATQDRASCVVYGMPKVADHLGASAIHGRPEMLPGMLLRELQKRETPATV
ncbi:MAG: hypothetical protein KDA32_13815 [Phycisphaerales bacterium]|nr:hypothetical protein [Phycisphaerales bacterium]